MSGETFRVDRLWPDPEAGIDLDAALAGFEPPTRPDRPGVAINMVTSIDGRAQIEGTAEGLGSRADRRLLRLYRAAFDAVASGAGTLRQAGAWLRVGDDLARRRVAQGRPANPIGVVIAGEEPVPTDVAWYGGDEPRIVIVGAANPMTAVPLGTELLRAPDPRPEPSWVLDRLGEHGIRSLLLEGGPTLNAAFLTAGALDEIYWTVGAHVLGTDALSMIAGGRAPDAAPHRARLLAVLRHDDELFLRYGLDPEGWDTRGIEHASPRPAGTSALPRVREQEEEA